MASKTLSPTQVAQLGGLACVRKNGKDAMAAIGSKGGSTTFEKHGREHYIRAAHVRWGRLEGKSNG